MNYVELDRNDMRVIVADCVAPAAALLLDLLDDGSLEGILVEASTIRDVAQVIVAGRVPG